MTNFHEGARVSYVGDGSDGRVLGEHGKILAINGRSGHVKWADSSVTLVDLQLDVAPLSSRTGAQRASLRDDLDDSLDVGPIQAVGMRGVYESEGSTGVINMLATTGQLGSWSSIAEDARQFVEQRVRQDPDFRQVTAQLDEEDADELISTACHVLLRDLCGVDDGD